MSRPDLAIIIPAYNEEMTIAAVVREARVHGIVVVVDDGSADATAAQAASVGAQVVSLPANQGYEGALSAGFAHAVTNGFRYAVTLDADGQLPAADVPLFVAELDGGRDLVVGIRARRPRKAETLFAAVTRLTVGMNDPLCGMKAYRLAAVATIGPFDTRRLVGSEMAIRMIMRGKAMAQRSVEVQDRLDASRYGVSFKGEWKILQSIGRAVGVMRDERRMRGAGR